MVPPADRGGVGRGAALIGLPFAVLAAAGVLLLLGNGIARMAGPTAPATSRPAATGSSGPVPASGPVTMAAPSLDAGTGAVCRALVAALPDRLRDRERRQVTAGDGQNAAWGTPAATLACGRPAPSVPPDAQLWVLDGVCWYSADGAVWDAVDRAVPVTVTLPGAAGAAGPGGQWVIELAGPITRTVPVARVVPSGCR
jgi:hypothetical protein